MRIHFIAIGGSVMHNLAIELHKGGHQISGSDDHIFDPSKGRLAAQGLLPETFGWFPEKITKNLDAIVLGMHARKDNPELKKAQELNISIYSYPEYIYQSFQNKKRVVIGGSHGKTTITAMILHVLKYCNRAFDYIIGAALEGFDSSVKISENAPVAIIEGDEYLSSPIDPTSKFLHYKQHIGVITGIAWDHINIFKTFDDYIKVFTQFADNSPQNGALIYHKGDDLVNSIGAKKRAGVQQLPYTQHPYRIEQGQTYLLTKNQGEVPVHLIGEHNMKNLLAAQLVCEQLEIEPTDFYQAIRSFKGAARRLEKVAATEQNAFFKDFAHAPSKVLATTEAMKQQFSDRCLIACLELHTFSSLNKEFLMQYKGALQAADIAVAYFNPEAIALKKLDPITKEDIQAAFDQDNLQVFDHISDLTSFLYNQAWENTNLLMMSSGNFDNLNLQQLAENILEKV